MKILPIAALLAFVVGCAQRVRHLRADRPSEKPLAVPRRLKTSDFSSVNPGEIVGSSRCGPQGSEEDLFEEAERKALDALMAGCPKKRVFQADGKVALVPSGEVVNPGPRKVRGTLCSIGNSGRKGIQLFVSVDRFRARVQCRVEGNQQKSDDSL